jgi:hypothetical protein
MNYPIIIGLGLKLLAMTNALASLQNGATTLSITTLIIMTFSIMTLSIMTFSITIRKCDTQHNNTLYNVMQFLMEGSLC